MVEIELGRLLDDLDRFSWTEWVYIQADAEISQSLPCLVIDTDAADLGSDGFTPSQVEQRGMIEFLSVQDLKGVIKFLENSKTDASTNLKCAAAAYYFERDAFMPTPSGHH